MGKVNRFLSLTILIGVVLNSCTSPAPFNSALEFEKSLQPLNQALRQSHIRAIWAPDGQKVALIASRWLASDETPSPSKIRHHQITVYASSDGTPLASWSLSLPDLREDSFIPDEHPFQLQWNASGTEFQILKDFTTPQQDVLELTRYQVPESHSGGYLGGPPPLKRQVFVPAALKSLSTTGLGQPRLSPDGKKIALYRYRDESKHTAEVMVLNLDTAESQTWGNLDSEQPLQAPQWAGASDSLFGMSSRGTSAEIQRLQFEKPISSVFQANLSQPNQHPLRFALSPNQSQAVVEFQSKTQNPTSTFVVAGPLGTDKAMPFELPRLLMPVGSIWNPSGELGLLHYQQSNSSHLEMKWLNPQTGTQRQAFEPRLIQNKLNPLFNRTDRQIGQPQGISVNAGSVPPFTMPTYFQNTQGVLDVYQSIVPHYFSLAAFSPRDNRLLLLVDGVRLNDGQYLAQRNLIERPFAFVLEPDKQRLVPLKTSVAESLGYSYQEGQKFEAPAEISLK
ncbi:MAG: hypothetical protein IV090_09985 [Candidatus Sericytochromatia bacterium]|nr:hypothetical protein [Candidatus Sericytochromatia bacterium]